MSNQQITESLSTDTEACTPCIPHNASEVVEETGVVEMPPEPRIPIDPPKANDESKVVVLAEDSQYVAAIEECHDISLAAEDPEIQEPLMTRPDVEIGDNANFCEDAKCEPKVAPLSEDEDERMVSLKRKRKKACDAFNSDSDSCSESNSYQRKTRRAAHASVTITLTSESDSEVGRGNSESDRDNEYRPSSSYVKVKKKRSQHLSRLSRDCKLYRKKKRGQKKSMTNNIHRRATTNQRFGRKKYFGPSNIHRQGMMSISNRGKRRFISCMRGTGRRGRGMQRPMERSQLTPLPLASNSANKKRIGRPPSQTSRSGRRRGCGRMVSKEEKPPLISFSTYVSEEDQRREQMENIAAPSEDIDPRDFVKHATSACNGKQTSAVNSPSKKRGRQQCDRSEVTKKVKHLKKKKRGVKAFLQKKSCFDVDIKLPKCRECRIAMYNKNKTQNTYCRFLDYRKLYVAKNGISACGFLTPSDAASEDVSAWVPHPEHPPNELNTETSKSLLIQVGDQFCDLIEQEREAVDLHVGLETGLTWKKIVHGVREMCDVCDTTIFNQHWVCPKCGLAVCIDCYKVRKQGIIITVEEEDQLKGRDEFLWLLCNGRQEHKLESMIMAQMIPANIVTWMQHAMHEVRDKLNIASYCKCKPQESFSDKVQISTGICKQLMSSVAKSFVVCPSSTNQYQAKNISFSSRNVDLRELDNHIPDNAMQWLSPNHAPWFESQPYVSFENNHQWQNPSGATTSDPYINYSSDFSSLIFAGNSNDMDEIVPLFDSAVSHPPSTAYSLEEFLNAVDDCVNKNLDKGKNSLRTFTSRYPLPNSGRDPLPIRIFTSRESEISYPNVPHSWLCNGRLLLLHQPNHGENLELFQEQWQRGQPVMVQCVDKCLDMSLWHPSGFCADFGEIKNDLVNCKTGAIISNVPMKKFWNGFESFKNRLKDEHGDYMLLKLKDWPPGEDFSEKLPKRFQDLMHALPLPEYTHRDGIFNLAGRLPGWYVRPDLGPKMYNAYGSALYPSKGTTNLHLDISDAVNVMVYVGVPDDDCSGEAHILEALKAIDEGGCDSLMARRARQPNMRPGALWHIYNARDADKIRDLLNKVAQERGEKLEAQNDPIHDQSWYIDASLRQRLYHEYGVEGYAIAQCLGDAVFIPAGAPHQVRNLHSCVKVAEDFVSPENIGHCFKLTQEFRHLSHTHTNHEDKLQIKNIIYHVVRDSLSCLISMDEIKSHGLNVP